MEHPDSVEDYFAHPVFGKKRFHRLLDAGIQRNPMGFLRLLWLIGKFEN